MTSSTASSEQLRRGQGQFRWTDWQAQALPGRGGLVNSVCQSGFAQVVDQTGLRCRGSGSSGGFLTDYRHDLTSTNNPGGS